MSGLAEGWLEFGAGVGVADMVAEVDDLDIAVGREAGAGRDEVTHDDVFLEAAQVVDAAQGGGLSKDTRGVLERRGGDEGIGLQRGLGNAEQNRHGLGGLAALLLDTDILVLEGEAVDLV